MLYSKIIESKNGFDVPLFADNKPACSKYDPLREAENFASNIQEDTNFFVIAGIAAGYHIESLLKKHSECKIIAFEDTNEDLDFCLSIKNIQRLKAQKNIIFATTKDIKKLILENYLPSVYGNFAFLPLTSWKLEKEHSLVNIKNEIEETLKQIADDYSVQCHFGKIWQRNIFLNLKSLDENKNLTECNFYADLEKTAAIIAAGPSLDISIKEIINQKESYFIISTDTAYPLLLRYNITPQVVISIDGQGISKIHFIDTPFFDKNKENTFFLFDLCASHEAVNLLSKRNHKIHFFASSHPLNIFAEQYFSFPQINSSGGTVTISALDFAIQCGFKKIKLYGADFSYSNGKTYAKGTYLDREFFNKSCRTNNIESLFTNLMFRTELKNDENESIFYGKLKEKKVSVLLRNYELNLFEFLNKNNCKVINKTIICSNKNSIQYSYYKQNFDYKKFFNDYKKQISFLTLENPVVYTLLPYISWLKNKNKNLNFNELLKLAHDNALRYN